MLKKMRVLFSMVPIFTKTFYIFPYILNIFGSRSPGNRFKRIANAFSSEDDDFEKAVERSKIETVHDDPDFLKVLFISPP